MLRPSDRLRPQRGHAGVDGHVEMLLSQIDFVLSSVSKRFGTSIIHILAVDPLCPDAEPRCPLVFVNV